mmetsp:Transcript_42740/g.110510  ORF Transcript_42740/g.110510 Transcript_42740/m.110510 type:complete len:544 (-) Transcript_42740:150-1781(-)
MLRSNQHLIGCDIHSHVGTVPRDQSAHEGEPDQVERSKANYDDWLHLWAQGPRRQRVPEVTEGAMLDPREDCVEEVKHYEVVEASDHAEQRYDEEVERPLVPKPDAVVDPGAVVIKAIHTSAALLAVVRAHLPAHPANNADMLEVALVDQGQVLATPLRQQLLHASPANALACGALTLAERHRGSVELGLLCLRLANAVHASHQRLQLHASRSAHATIAVIQPLPRLSDELALVVELVLLQLHPRQVPLRCHQICGDAVVVHHLRLHRLLRIKGHSRVLADQVMLRPDRARLDPARVREAVLDPEQQRNAHEQRPADDDVRVLVGDAWRQHKGKDANVEGDEANEEVGKVVVRDVRPPYKVLEELALVEEHHQIPVLLPHRQGYGRVASGVWHVEQVHGAHVQQHLDSLLVALECRPVDGRHALVIPVDDAGRPRQQPLHRPPVPLVAGPLERSPAPVVLLFHTDALEVHPLHHRGVVVLGGDAEGGEAIAVAQREEPTVCARHGVQRRDIGRLRGPVHRGLAGGVAEVRPRLPLEELLAQGV